jgi:hypothetical protein
VSGDRRAVFPAFGGEIPIKLRPSGVPMNVDGDIVRAQSSPGEGVAHQMPVDVVLDLVQAVLVTQRVDEGDFRRVQPNL